MTPKLSLEMAHKVIVPQKKNYVPQFLKQRDINSYCTRLTIEQSWQDKNLLYCYDEPNEPTKEGPLPYVLQESPFASVSTVSRGHPSLVSLESA